MSEQIIIDVKTTKSNNKVNVRQKTKKDRYTKLFSNECRVFVTSLINFVQSIGKLFFYALVVVGLLFQEWGKKQKIKREKQEKAPDKMF